MSIYERLAMTMNEGGRVLVAGRWMPPVRAAATEIRHRLKPNTLVRNATSGCRLLLTTTDGGRLDGVAGRPDMMRGHKPDAMLWVGECDEAAYSLLDSMAAAGAVTYQTLGV